MCPSITRTSEEVDSEVVFIVLPKRLACLTSDYLQVMLFIIGSSSSEGKMRGRHARRPPPLPPPSHAGNVSHPRGKANTLPPPPSPHRPASNKRFPFSASSHSHPFSSAESFCCSGIIRPVGPSLAAVSASQPLSNYRWEKLPPTTNNRERKKATNQPTHLTQSVVCVCRQSRASEWEMVQTIPS